MADAEKNTVERIARLARLRLRPEEMSRVQANFTKILAYFEFLGEVNTKGVNPMFHATEALTLRPDEPEAPLSVESLLVNAPDSFEGSFRIPRVVGSEE